MEKICIKIVYTNEVLKNICVDYKEDLDIDSIKRKPIPEWFEPGKGRDGWEGLVPELQYMVNDNKIEWVFDFEGDDENRQLFKKCMKEYDPVFPWSADGMTEEEISARNLEIAEECELRGEKQEALRHYFIAADEGNDAKMQLFLANLYKDMADGKETDYPIDEPHPMEKAVEYYEKAAENGNIKALKIVNEMYKENAKKEAEETLKKLIAEKVKEIIDSKIKEMAKGFYIVDGELLKYNGTDSYVTIPDSVTIIGNWAFRDCTSLEKVTIPDSVTSIGDCAFKNRTSLKKVTIPNSVTSIGGDAFKGCTSLKEVTIPDSVTSIGGYAFDNTEWLKNYPNDFVIINGILIKYKGTKTNVVIPDSVTSIGDCAFEYCTSLEKVTIPDSITSIGDNAFFGCTSLEKVTIPDSVTSIGGYAFVYCTSLKEVTIPDSVKSIDSWAFGDCTSLKEVRIPKNCDIATGELSSFERYTKVIRRK